MHLISHSSYVHGSLFGVHERISDRGVLVLVIMLDL
jgi:hypothetical protein